MKNRLPINYVTLMRRLRGKVAWMRHTNALEKLVAAGLAQATGADGLGAWVELTHAGAAYLREHCHED